MSEPATTARPVGIVVKTTRPDVTEAMIAIAAGLLLKTHSAIPLFTLLLRAVIVGLSAATAFTFFEVWPRQLPRWFQRWALQVVAVGVFMPVTTFLIYVLFTPPRCATVLGGERPPDRLVWCSSLLAILVAPWSALMAVVRQKEAVSARPEPCVRARAQRAGASGARRAFASAAGAGRPAFPLQHARERAGARRCRLAACVGRASQPHRVLRAAVPLLHEAAATIERELQLVRPYLELMHMRMPDRLQYAMNVDSSALEVRCPPTTLLTLVENAVRHGIDPSEEGGRIDIDIVRIGERCVVRVTDTGAGLHQSANGLGTGADGAARTAAADIWGGGAAAGGRRTIPCGVAVEIEMPALTGAPDARTLRVGVET